MTKKGVREVTAILILTLVGCGGKGGTAPAAAGSGEQKAAAGGEKTATAAATESGKPPSPHLGAFRLGHELSPEGVAGREDRTFGAGEFVCVSFDLLGSPADAKLHVRVVTKSDEKTVLEQDVAVAAGKSPNVSFKMETKGLAPGDYVLQKIMSSASAKIDGQTLGKADFKVVKERPT